MFLVREKINAEPIPKIAVSTRYVIPAAKLNFQIKKAIGICMPVQRVVVIRLAVSSFLVTKSSLVKRYPRKADSSENAVAKESPSEVMSGKLPILAPKLKPLYFR
jgi:hypothetical protein